MAAKKVLNNRAAPPPNDGEMRNKIEFIFIRLWVIRIISRKFAP
jgi:hypothetical protein